ncbi:hypothetical protein QN277_002630 [Acacia crassicarpa]|uniref:Retrotransposon Copia-like N-terminal domain-containing protein n=1 Tax=Acacia crassicarpa TaxID=499986 RepID=A0AAE1NBE5_9FABA|nr:hypothetical protein QN277_002630 [Acacia crassicarpa]
MASATTSDQPSSHTSPFVVSAIPLPVTDPSSSFYIHPKENPTLVLVTPPLDGTNYHSWSRSMRSALLSKNKLRFINGSILPPPLTDANFPAWERCNNLILWDEMANIRPLKPCTCGFISQALLHRDDDKVIRFLKGLNESFASVKSQIMLLDPLPPITRVFSLIVQQEREMRIPLVSPESSVLMAKGSRFPNHPSSKPKLCSYCGKPRHTEETCYRKHGFPPGFKFRSSGSSSMVNNLSTKDSGSGFVQAPSLAMVSSPVPSPSHAAILPQLSVAQYTRLLSLLECPSTSTPSVNQLSASLSVPTEGNSKSNMSVS